MSTPPLPARAAGTWAIVADADETLARDGLVPSIILQKSKAKAEDLAARHPPVGQLEAVAAAGDDPDAHAFGCSRSRPAAVASANSFRFTWPLVSSQRPASSL